MEIEITGNISADPRDRVLAIEAVTKSICQMHGMDPAEGVMMLLTAAAHITSVHSKKPASENILALATSLGHATVAADDFFKLKAVTGRAALERSEGPPVHNQPVDSGNSGENV